MKAITFLAALLVLGIAIAQAKDKQGAKKFQGKPIEVKSPKERALASFERVMSRDFKKAAKSQDSRIYGGSSAALGDFPHIVSLQWYNEVTFGVWLSFCGGAIINEYWVLSAEECDVRVGERAVAGKLDISVDADDVNAQYREIGYVAVYDEHAAVVSRANLVLAMVTEPFDLTGGFVKAAKLPSSSNLQMATGTACQLAGWDDEAFIHKDYALQSATLNLMDKGTCNSILLDYYLYDPNDYYPDDYLDYIVDLLWFDEDNDICASAPNTLYCIEERGTPLTCGNDEVLYGIASNNAFATDNCNFYNATGVPISWPSVFVEIPRYLPWIQRTAVVPTTTTTTTTTTTKPPTIKTTTKPPTTKTTAKVTTPKPTAAQTTTSNSAVTLGYSFLIFALSALVNVI